MTTLLKLSEAAIGDDQIRQYEDDGVICLRGLFSEEWLGRLRAATDRLLMDGGGQDMNNKNAQGKFSGDMYMFRKNKDFLDFAYESPSWLIAKTLMRSQEVRLFTDQLFVKEPGTSTPTPWHHDQPYWPVLGEHVCSVWVTMDSVTKETSGLEYIRGSHKWNKRFDPADFGESVSLEMFRDAKNDKMPDIDANRDQYEFLSWDMEPGDCLVHHSLAVHGAGGNKSATRRRRAVSTRWFGDEAFYRPHGRLQPQVVGLEPGARMTSPMFPIVPGDGSAALPPLPGLG